MESKKETVISTPKDSLTHLPFWNGLGYVYNKDEYAREEEENIEVKEKGFRELPIEVNLPLRSTTGGIASMGRLVTQNAANVMIRAFNKKVKNKIDEINEDKSQGINLSDKQINIVASAFIALLPDNRRVIFGKESLLFLLSQSGCEGIRFYYCVNREGISSLVLVGVDRCGHDLGQEQLSNRHITRIIDQPISTDVQQESRLSDRQKTAIVEVGGTDPAKRK